MQQKFGKSQEGFTEGGGIPSSPGSWLTKLKRVIGWISLYFLFSYLNVINLYRFLQYIHDKFLSPNHICVKYSLVILWGGGRGEGSNVSHT